MLTSSYDFRLVALSVLIAVGASYLAFDLTARATAARGRRFVLWLVGAAITLGAGIWSMHYVAMLALRLPVPLSYDWPTAMMSLRVAIVASAVAIYIISRESITVWRMVLGSIVLASGISGMHYIGMAAMLSTAESHYDPRLVAMSVVLGAVISFEALRLLFQSREEKRRFGPKKLASAGAMGLAVAAVHFTGMAAVHFTAGGVNPDLSHVMSINVLSAAGISIFTMMILVVAVLASVLDRRISAQSQELESVEQRYRLLFERTMAGVIRTSLGGQILECNLACAQIFGYASCEEMIASSISDRYPDPKDRDAFLERLQSAKSLTNYEECLRRKDGSKVWILGSANLVESKVGAPAVIERTFVDVTERKNAAELFRKAFNANPEPITIATIPDGRYLDVNESFFRVTGYSRDEVIGRTSRDLQFWGKSEERAVFLDRIMLEGSVRDLEITFRTKSGEMRTALDSAEVIEVGGQKCAIAIFRDVTHRKSLENQLRQTQKMEAVGQLSGGIAHDFNNLLGVIMGYSEILEQRLPSGDPLHKECAQIMKAAQSAASLTRQLLAFSRQQVLEPRILDLNAIVLNVEKMLRRLIGKHIDLRTNLDPALENVRTDQSQVEQVIINLAVNARDAMPDGGKLLIETSNVELDEEYARLHPPQLAGSYEIGRAHV
jgi:PAS domain S-box-containing protein